MASHVVATGLCDKLGNKGGIAIAFAIGKTNFCFLTAHLAAHQSQMDRRTAEFIRISKEVTQVLGQSKETNVINTKEDQDENDIGKLPEIDPDYGGSEEDCFEDNCSTQDQSQTRSSSQDSSKCFCPNCLKPVKECNLCRCLIHHDQKHNPLPNAFDHVILGGDLNFRIHGTRDIVDSLLAQNRHNILFDNDQLNMLMQFDEVFSGFVEGPLSFRPTYKFDKCSGKLKIIFLFGLSFNAFFIAKGCSSLAFLLDVYDTSQKRRIPAWTDRILYKPSSDIDLISYSSASELRTSDHRPVYASFQCVIDIDGSHFQRTLFRSESKSEVCVIS